MAVYQARDLANGITNTEPVFGSNSQQETFSPSATYSYNVVQAGTWALARVTDATTVDTNFFLKNTFTTSKYDLTRTGVQYDASLSFTPIGIGIDISIDSIALPSGIRSFNIRVYKGRSQDLIGAVGENKIPSNSGYVPYSSEITITDPGRYTIYLNSLATNNLIIRNGKLNFFILGEFDYNNIPPEKRYEVGYIGSDPNLTLTVFD